MHGFLWSWVCSWLIFSLKWHLRSPFLLLHSTAIDLQEAKDFIDKEDPRPISFTWSYIRFIEDLAPQNNKVSFNFRPTFSSSWMSKKCSTWMEGSLSMCMVAIFMVEMALMARVFVEAIWEGRKLGLKNSKGKLLSLAASKSHWIVTNN